MNLRQELGDQADRSRARRSNNLVPNYNGYVPSVTGFRHRVCVRFHLFSLLLWAGGKARLGTRIIEDVYQAVRMVNLELPLGRPVFLSTL
jgi:hypothetical protein